MNNLSDTVDSHMGHSYAGESHTHLLVRMLDRCDVDIQQLTDDCLGQAMAETMRICALCANAQSCRSWLQATAGEHHLHPPAFCPNARRFEKAARRMTAA